MENPTSSSEEGGAGDKRVRRRCSGRPKRRRRASHSAREDAVAGDARRVRVYSGATLGICVSDKAMAKDLERDASTRTVTVGERSSG